MKDKTELAKDHLLAAIKLLDSNALADARFNIGRAIREVEKVEKDRGKRDSRAEMNTQAPSLADQWKERLKFSVGNMASPAESLQQLDKMIDMEKNKLTKPDEPKKLDTLFD